MKILKIAGIAMAMTAASGTALAELVFPSLSYRTGPYAVNGIPFADGYADYMTPVSYTHLTLPTILLV